MAAGPRRHPEGGQGQPPAGHAAPRRLGAAPPRVLPLLEDQHLCLKNIAYQHFTYISSESASCSTGGDALQSHGPRANEVLTMSG